MALPGDVVPSEPLDRLLAAARGGDPVARERVVVAVYEPLLRLVSHVIRVEFPAHWRRPHVDSGSVANRVAMRVLGQERFQPQTIDDVFRFAASLVRLELLSKVRGHARRARLAPTRSMDGSAGNSTRGDIADTAPGPADAAATAELLERVGREVTGLPARDATVVSAWLAGESYTDIDRRLGLPTKTSLRCVSRFVSRLSTLAVADERR